MTTEDEMVSIINSMDTLPLATRMQTRLPRRPTRGSLTSPSYLVRNRTLGPPLEARFPYHGSGAMTRSPSPLECRPDFPDAPREAH